MCTFNLIVRQSAVCLGKKESLFFYMNVEVCPTTLEDVRVQLPTAVVARSSFISRPMDLQYLAPEHILGSGQRVLTYHLSLHTIPVLQLLQKQCLHRLYHCNHVWSHPTCKQGQRCPDPATLSQTYHTKLQFFALKITNPFFERSRWAVRRARLAKCISRRALGCRPDLEHL